MKKFSVLYVTETHWKACCWLFILVTLLQFNGYPIYIWAWCVGLAWADRARWLGSWDFYILK